MISCLSNHFELLRPFNVLISALAMVISASILGELLNHEKLIPVIITVMCFTGAANAINDFIDFKVDQINRPNRPIPSGRVQRKSALIISILLFLIGSFFCFKLGKNAIIVGFFVSLPLIVLYSIFFKGLPLIGNIVTSLILGLSFIFCGFAFDNIPHMIAPALLAFGLTLLREIIKDISDIDGDKLLGLKTLPICIGLNRACNLAILFSSVIFLCSLIPFFKGLYGIWYLILLIIGVEIPLMYIVFLLWNKPKISSASQCEKILKFSTLVGLFAIYGGSFK
tara:strand:+ start:1359 stop:2204 length:846 start_codon:yes stop_codon:yes gene_type:complete